MSQARHRTVQVPGGSIYYRTCGTGAASSPPSYATCYAGRPLAGRETPRSPRR
jgi:hypothetical protein